jgi:ParB family transcriptional regulator, chromosome partitioning protein
MEQLVLLSSLAPSASNARRTHRLIDIDVLAAQIRSQGLLQKLIVRETTEGRYEVVDGQRRLAALKWLVREGARPKTEPVPVLVLGSDHDDTEVSLVANTRVAMHPADTFEAFRRLADREGASPELIGQRFGYAVTTVKGFLKLANLSPRLLRAFRKDELTLDQMKALALTDDHKRQDAAFFDAPDYLRDPASLRRGLMKGRIAADDKFARFVGVAHYEQAGGALTRDLFGGDGDLFLDNAALLQKLVAEKLDREADSLRKQGWKWVEVQADLTTADFYRLTIVSTATHGFAASDPAARSYAGIILGIDHDGQLKTIPGVLRPDDAKALARARTPEGKGSAKVAASATVAQSTGALPAPVIEELTAIRTMALRAEILNRPELALAILVHDLALVMFYPGWESDRKLSGITSRITDAASLIAHRETDKAALAVEAVNAAWAENLPPEAAGLWPWLLLQEPAMLMQLLACLAASQIDAIHPRHDKRIPVRVTASHHLAQAVALDMTAFWTVEAGFLARLPKAVILGIVAEAVSPQVAQNCGRGSKADVVAAAERQLAGKNWLPPVLCKPDATGMPTDTSATDPDGATLDEGIGSADDAEADVE